MSKPWAIATVALNVKKTGRGQGLVTERVTFLFELYQRTTRSLPHTTAQAPHR